jgi:hypothetical protein
VVAATTAVETQLQSWDVNKSHVSDELNSSMAASCDSEAEVDDFDVTAIVHAMDVPQAHRNVSGELPAGTFTVCRLQRLLNTLPENLWHALV